MTDEQKLMQVALNAAATLGAVYEMLEYTEKAGGTTSISGISACHAMLTSLRKNKARVDKLVLEPLRAIIEKEAAE